ncbi:Sjogren's syndrome/scleroderma autoantigen 1 family protein [Candidatus Pyrohabitans sp.]
MEKDANIKKMVELLLGRATMLAYHCPSCSAPLFEKEGKVLCPKCGEVKVVREGEDEVEEKTPAPARAEAKPQKEDEILQKKREELLLRLKDERDLRVILDILEAVRRIDGILRD